MSKWQQVKLGDVSESCLGKMLDQHKNKGELQPYLANIDVRWGEFDLEHLGLMKFESHEQERYGLQYGDLVICEGGEPGRCAIWKNQIPNIKIQKALHRVRTDKNILDNRFLFYWFLLAGKTGELEQYFTGATIKHMPGQKLKEVEIPLPPIEVQRKIANVLSAYDDLIENNRRQIKLLEEAARRLYKEWFIDLRFPGHETTPIIDGVPDGWKKTLLGNLIEIKYGKDHKNIPDGNIPVYGSGGFMRKCSQALHQGEAVLIPRKGSLNNIMYVNETFWTVDTMFYALMKQQDVGFFVYFLLKSFDMYKMNIGAAVPSMTTSILNAIDVVLPSAIILEDFHRNVNALFKRILTLNKQNDKLMETRNRLLTKLL